MQRLDSLWKLVSAASAVRDMAFEKKAYEFKVAPKTTFYLHAENARLTLKRWHEPKITVHAELQAGFGWRIQTEQDDAGVYLVAKRRTIIGNLSRAQFRVLLPHDAYVVVKMENGSVEMDDIQHTLHIPPPDSDNTVTIQITTAR
jgi:hypothetical protein